jgi:hypothetical protein
VCELKKPVSNLSYVIVLLYEAAETSPQKRTQQYCVLEFTVYIVNLLRNVEYAVVMDASAKRKCPYIPFAVCAWPRFCGIMPLTVHLTEI